MSAFVAASSRSRSDLVATLPWIASKISVAMRSATGRSILASARAFVSKSRSVIGYNPPCHLLPDYVPAGNVGRVKRIVTRHPPADQRGWLPFAPPDRRRLKFPQNREFLAI